MYIYVSHTHRSLHAHVTTYTSLPASIPMHPIAFQVLSILSGPCPVQTGQRDCIVGGFAMGKSLASSHVQHGSRFKLSKCVQGGGAQLSSQQSSFCNCLFICCCWLPDGNSLKVG